MRDLHIGNGSTSSRRLMIAVTSRARFSFSVPFDQPVHASECHWSTDPNLAPR